jgi:CubicO group peptidase (beta-lactamase class C family)
VIAARRLLALRGGLALLAASTVSLQAQTPPRSYRVDVGQRFSAEDTALYLERLALRARLQADFETYDTVEPVPGAPRWKPLPQATDHSATISREALEAAASYAAASPSTSLLVWRRGRVELERYFGERRARDTILGRSLAKPLATIAVGRAIALGHIRSLDQPVADFIVEWRADPRRSRIRVHHLLDGTAGFLPQGYSVQADDVLNLAFLHPRHDEIIVSDYPVVSAPGAEFSYNNAQFDLIALLIERATGQRYHEFVGERLLRPIGAAGGEVWVNRPGGTPHAGCCLQIPPESWLRLGVLLVQDGRWEGRALLPPGFARQMATGTAANPYYGLGVYVAGDYTPRRGWAGPQRTPPAMQVLHSEPYLAADLYLFDGNGHQVMYLVPSEQLVVLRTGTGPPRPQEWDNSRLPNLLMRGIRRAPGEPAPPAQAATHQPPLPGSPLNGPTSSGVIQPP